MPVVRPVSNPPRIKLLTLAALLGLIALALPLGAPGGHTHHGDGPGFYDGQCPLLALDGLGTVGHPPGSPESIGLVLVAIALVAVAPDRSSSAPARHTDPRAPPLA
jgi:hypothetical protein